jgi:hypothetical protein
VRVRQISVFVENQPGRLQSILEVMEHAGLSIQALSASDTAEFGIVRMILADPELAPADPKQAGGLQSDIGPAGGGARSRAAGDVEGRRHGEGQSRGGGPGALIGWSMRPGLDPVS